MNHNSLTRRRFLAGACAAASGASIAPVTHGQQRPAAAGGGALGISYSSYSIRWQAASSDGALPRMTGAVDFLKHAKTLGAAGVQTLVGEWDAAQARAVRDLTEREGLFFEGQVQLPRGPADRVRGEDR